MTSGITPLGEWARKNVRIRNEYITQPLAEFLGTLILCLFAVGAGAQIRLMDGEPVMMAVFGGVFGIMIAITALGGLSGAHINPVVTFAVALGGHLSWFKVPLFWICQFLGAYCGAGIAFGIYKVQLERKFQTTDLTTIPNVSGIFAHFPGDQSTGFLGIGMADQITCSCILIIAVYSAVDPRNMGLPKWFIGPYFMLVVAGINFAFGYNAGGAMNPARDLAPRLMAITLGWGRDDVFMYKDPSNNWHHYWLISLFGPFIGALLGALIYIFLIGSHLPDTKEEMEALYNNNNKPGDWRSTHFIPKAAVPPEMQMTPPSGTPSPYNRNSALANGVHNPALVRDELRKQY